MRHTIAVSWFFIATLAPLSGMTPSEYEEIIPIGQNYRHSLPLAELPSSLLSARVCIALKETAQLLKKHLHNEHEQYQAAMQKYSLNTHAVTSIQEKQALLHTTDSLLNGIITILEQETVTVKIVDPLIRAIPALSLSYITTQHSHLPPTVTVQKITENEYRVTDNSTHYRSTMLALLHYGQ